MKLYQIANLYVGTQAEAKAAAKERGVSYEQIEVPTDKEGLIGYLNSLGDDAPQPADDQFTSVYERQDPEVEQVEVIRDNPLQFDDAWENFPLAKKLHFASLACEEAREIIKPVSTQNQTGLLKANAAIAGDDDELFT